MVLSAVVAFAMVLALGFVRLGIASVNATRAQRAADLAALSGAQQLASSTTARSCGRASGIAKTNGADLLSCDVRGWSLRVTVRYRSVTRSAAAALSAGP